MTPETARRTGGEHGQISTGQFVWMLFAIVTAGSSTAVPRLLLDVARQDSWLAVLIAWVIDVGLALVYAYMGLRFPGETFVQYASSVFGRWIGKPLGLIYPLFFFLVGAVQLRAISDVMGTIFLRGTPQSVIAMTALAAGVYAARSGLEVTARVAQVLGPIFIAAAAVLTVLVSPHIRLERLQPVMEQGLSPVLQGVPFTLSLLAVCIVMGMFQAYQRKPGEAFRAKLIAVTMGALLLALIVALAATVIGAAVAGESRYPDLEVARIISIADFLERLEVLWVVIDLGAAVVALAVLLWAAALGIAQTCGLRAYQPLVLPLAGLMLPISILLFASPTERGEFIRSVFPFYALLIEAGLEVLVWLGALLLGRRGRSTAAPGAVP